MAYSPKIFIYSCSFLLALLILALFQGRVTQADSILNDQLTVGDYFACLLDDAGISCRGNNDQGQLHVPTLNNPSQVATGVSHTCALDDTGVVCWGDNNQGQLNIPELNHPKQITAGRYHTCAMDDTGVVCWGNNDEGQTSVPILNQPSQVTAGAYFTCAIDKSGVVCWGQNDDEQTRPATSLNQPLKIAAGLYHACALEGLGITCWGNNDKGQTHVPKLTHPRQITAGDAHTCAIDDFGVTCWGNDEIGTTHVPALTNPTQVVAGGFQTCAIDDSGVVCWGQEADKLTDVFKNTQPKQIAIGLGGYRCTPEVIDAVCWKYKAETPSKAIAITSKIASPKGGDANGDGVVDILDIVRVINIVLGSGGAVNGADCNHDNTVNIQDVVCTINKVLNGGGEVSQLTSLYIAGETINLREDGVKDITVLGRYDDGASIDKSAEVSFIVADNHIITLNKGTITPVAIGTTTFKATLDGIDSNTISVTVVEKIDETKIIKNSFYDQNKQLIPADASLTNYDNNTFALITGLVKDKAAAPLANVIIKIFQHPQYGSAKTDANGKFTLPVEGGGSLTLNYIHAGYLPLDREVDVPVNNWMNIDPATLSQLDIKVTPVQLAIEKTTLHISSKVDDDRGERETTLVFNGVTKATITRKDGTTHELKEIDVRATEFDKPEAMPAKLPEGTAFTFATALTVDGVEAGSEVSFDKPVIIYLDNFLKFDVGEIVPVGFYNEKTAQWEAADNGVVVKLLDTNNDGKVDSIDSTGDGQANDLNNDGTTDDEVAGIKEDAKYTVGKTYWRAEIPHFTTWDLNYGSAAKLNESDKKLEDERVVKPWKTQVTPPSNDADKGLSCSAGDSYVDVQTQVYHEDIPLAGTDLTLNYSSDRVKGYQHVISTAVSGAEIPAALMSITAKLDIAGKSYSKTLPAQANQR